MTPNPLLKKLGYADTDRLVILQFENYDAEEADRRLGFL